MYNDVDVAVNRSRAILPFSQKARFTRMQRFTLVTYKLGKGALLCVSVSIWITCVFVHMDNLVLVHMDNFRYFLSIWTTNLYIWITFDDFCTYG